MKLYLKTTRIFILSLVTMLIINSGCKKQALTYTTTSDVNIVDYLREYPSQYSEFVKILDRTNISSYLNAYGTYTCFAPTNDAIKLYLTKIGKTSTDELDTATLKNIIRLHLIQDTLSTPSFTDGKLATPTMYGQYLIMGSAVSSGISSIVVNRQALITQSNILTGNGYIHAIDHVLQPATLTVAAMVEANSKFSIFTQALKATKLYDTLNIVNNPDTTRRWLTFIAETDSVLKVAGINSYADLYVKYCKTGNPANVNDSLYLYMAYHILPGIKYLADLISAPSHQTLVPLNVISTTLSVDSVIINRATFNGVLEAGVMIDRSNSDNSCTNGALHSVLGDVYLKIRTPSPVYWDVADQPEIRKVTTLFRRAGKNQAFAYGSLAGVTWQNSAINCTYTCEAATTTNFYYWDDHFDVNLRFGNAAANNWVEFTTPLLVKGTYKVWVCYRVGTQGQFVQVSFDGSPLSRIIDVSNKNGYLDKTVTNDVLESQGYKRYTLAPASNNTQVGQLAGAVTIATTDFHKIRLTAIKDYGSGTTGGATLDMIHFIPIDMSQQRPVFGRDGSITP